MTRITVFGAGYVGLVQAAALAEAGYHVVCVDVDEDKVARLSKGFIPIFEAGLERIVQEAIAAKRLSFTTCVAEAVAFGDIQFIAVGTPPSADGSADLSYVMSVADAIGNHAEREVIVVTKSTVPVGTGDRIREAIAKRLEERGRPDISFDVASNPEFLREGSAVADCMKPDRIILGTSNPDTEAALRGLYAPFSRRSNDKFVVMDIRSAELTKYAANAMLAARITIMNEFAVLADRLDANIESVRLGVGKDPRIGSAYIYPGAGYGGSCFPKDIRALIHMAGENDISAVVLEAVENRNASQKKLLFEKISAHFGSDLKGRKFALWGLAFKPNTDDMRDAPSRDLMEALWAAGATVAAFDPKAQEECARIYGQRPDLTFGGQDDVVRDADALIVITEWKTFRAPDLNELRQALKSPVVFDGRNLFDLKSMSSHGFTYYSIGRPVARPA